MAKKKVSRMDPATTLGVADVFNVVQSGQSKKASMALLASVFGLSFQETTLTSAQILDIHNTPVLVVDAPAAGSYNIVLSVDYILDYGGTAYTRVNSAAFQLFYGPTRSNSTGTITVGAIMTQTEDAVSGGGAGVMSTRVLSLVDNTPIYITTSASNGSFTSGNGTLKVRVAYQTITV